MSTEPILQTAELVKHYGDQPGLGPVDLVFQPGERAVLVGANGSGKTTLMKLASGVLDPTSGSVTIDGQPAGSIGARAALSFITDTPVFYDDLSLIEHLEYIAGLHGVADWQPKADELIERLGLGDRIDQLPSTFSRGLRQKASIAISLVRPYALLLVDEPYVGLDAPGRRALDQLLDAAHATGAAVLVATHQLDHVAAVDRCIVLRDGGVVHDGPSTTAEAQRLIADQTD